MSNQTQKSLEKYLEKFPPPDLDAETTFEESFGPLENWIVQLEGHQIFLDPLIRKWFIYDRAHDEWQPTGIGPGQAEFVVVGHLLGVRKPHSEAETPPEDILEAATVMRSMPTIGLKINALEFPHPVPITGPLTIGRGKQNQIMLSDEQASRQHARILWDGSTLQVEDLGTTNGTEVNNLQITAPTRLNPGDILTVGNTNIKIITIADEETA